MKALGPRLWDSRLRVEGLGFRASVLVINTDVGLGLNWPQTGESRVGTRIAIGIPLRLGCRRNLSVVEGRQFFWSDTLIYINLGCC